MSENLDSPVPDGLGPISELPTTGPTFQGRQIVANRYEILSRLGRGGMGEVWHAYDLKLRVDVALKSLRLDLKRSQDPVEALRREVRTAREVISPNVCRIFDLVVEEDQELISMEYIDGITLTAMLVKKGALELREARDIAAQFLAGLEAIHQAGLVHRDLKPENIMITRTGRVVVMDFGIAKQITQLGGTISGTLPYMSPEQLSGQKVDARSDVFSAGIVLAEMIHPQGVFGQKTREEIWNGVRKHPMQLPESPWKAVIARAVAEEPENRFPSAGALARALEEVTQRVETIEERKPYPGLSSFTAADAEYFFGRELEVETVIKKLQQLHLMALIGPSGAGKTSFLRAGLIPALPAGWSHVFCTPGDAPLVNLGQSLVPELSGDMEAMRKMVRLEDTDTALWLLHRWSENHPEAVLIVDRFEELFTLNNPQTQSRFAELLGRAALEADIRVLLTMRDDFLMLCHDHAALIPIFSELTGLSPLSGAALRRALVQPALRCNYRFEDESLVDEILADVEKERGALPLMAFAAARLWEKRDRQTGQLTREAYKEIGGVAGALAQHAEATMERIGVERLPIVREIFRNLITAQNTRAARDTEELLSVFPEKQTAEEVLRTMIDARLFTSFEAAQAEGEKPRRRVEIIHESLLSNWPRLIRWQTQDADSAQLRDQLRQAAQLWEQRGRSQDLLWTGAAFLEFQAWRQRYPGGLTTAEEAFAQAMIQRAGKRRRQRRIVVSTIFIILLAVMAVIVNSWRGEKAAREQAVSETQRAEASKLLALGRNELEKDPTVSLAYAVSSLELADTKVARHFALEALAKAPPVSMFPEMPIKPSYLQFSPDGKRLLVGGFGGIRLLNRDGEGSIILDDGFAPILRQRHPQFSPDGSYVVWTSAYDPSIVYVWSLADRKEVRRFKMEGETLCLVRGSRLFTFTDKLATHRKHMDLGAAPIHGEFGEGIVVRSWQFNNEEPELLGTIDLSGVWDLDINSYGGWMVYTRGQSVYIKEVKGFAAASERIVGQHAADTRHVIFHPHEQKVASSDANGEIRIWSVTSEDSSTPVRSFPATGDIWNLSFNNSGSILAVSYKDMGVCLWNLTGLYENEPTLLRRRIPPNFPCVAFAPSDNRVAVAYVDSIAFWPVYRDYGYVLRGPEKENGTEHGLSFTPDGKRFAVAFGAGTIRLSPWPAGPSQILRQPGLGQTLNLKAHPSGRFLGFGTKDEDSAFVMSIPDGKEKKLSGGIPGAGFLYFSFSPDGKLAAGAPHHLIRSEDSGIRIWELESESVRILQGSTGMRVSALEFSRLGELFSGDDKGNLYRWNLREGTNTIVAKASKPGMVIHSIATAKNSPNLIACVWLSNFIAGLSAELRSDLRLFDLKGGISRSITTHGDRVFEAALDPQGKILVTGSVDGIVRVGAVSGEEPHMLFGHESVSSVAIHPNGEWIASSEGSLNAAVRLWHMPKSKPFHTLPYDEFVNRLRALSNIKVVSDKNSPTGYRTEYSPFAGWYKAPAW